MTFETYQQTIWNEYTKFGTYLQAEFGIRSTKELCTPTTGGAKGVDKVCKFRWILVIATVALVLGCWK